jgi:hypothetical protein
MIVVARVNRALGCWPRNPCHATWNKQQSQPLLEAFFENERSRLHRWLLQMEYMIWGFPKIGLSQKIKVLDDHFSIETIGIFGIPQFQETSISFKTSLLQKSPKGLAGFDAPNAARLWISGYSSIIPSSQITHPPFLWSQLCGNSLINPGFVWGCLILWGRDYVCHHSDSWFRRQLNAYLSGWLNRTRHASCVWRDAPKSGQSFI